MLSAVAVSVEVLNGERLQMGYASVMPDRNVLLVVASMRLRLGEDCRDW